MSPPLVLNQVTEMDDKISFVLDRTGQSPALEFPACEDPLDLVVLHADPKLTAHAVSAALKLANGFAAEITLLAVHVVPYPAPLECQEGVRQCLEEELSAVARATHASLNINVVFARDREEICLDLLRHKSLVVMGTRDRWWRTSEERFARTLAAHGHSVALIKVK